jgi:hypothetical protein
MTENKSGGFSKAARSAIRTHCAAVRSEIRTPLEYDLESGNRLYEKLMFKQESEAMSRLALRIDSKASHLLPQGRAANPEQFRCGGKLTIGEGECPQDMTLLGVLASVFK